LLPKRKLSAWANLPEPRRRLFGRARILPTMSWGMLRPTRPLLPWGRRWPCRERGLLQVLLFPFFLSVLACFTEFLRVSFSADMAGERRTSTPQERLLKGRAEKRKTAETPALPSKRPAGVPQASVEAPGSAPVPRSAQCVQGTTRGSQPSVPRESQPPSGVTSRGGASVSVVPPLAAGSGSRRGGSPSSLPPAISSSQLLDLGRRCRRPDMSSVDSLHAGLSYLGKVFVYVCIVIRVFCVLAA
jgi:hypothetical protein